MAWRIAVGFCVFGAGWYALDQHMPDLLPRIDVAVMTAVKRLSYASSSFAVEGKDTSDSCLEAIPQPEAMGAVEKQATVNEDKNCKDARIIGVEESRESENKLSVVEQAHDDEDGKDRGEIEHETRIHLETRQAENNEKQDSKDTRHFGLDGSLQRDSENAAEQAGDGGIVGERGSTSLGQSRKHVGDHGAASLAQGDDTSVTLRFSSRTRTLLSEHMMDTLVPPDMQSLLQEASEAVQKAESESDVGIDIVSMLLTVYAAILCILVAMMCCNGTQKRNTSEVEPSPAAPVDDVAVDWKSIFSISEMARLDTASKRHKGGYICPKGLSPALKSFRRAVSAAFDEDYGATVNTMLEDSILHVEELAPPSDDTIRSEDELS
ncbi:hypothetical protein MTO96_051110 [Rhipicephalus appendiculatus]